MLLIAVTMPVALAAAPATAATGASAGPAFVGACNMLHAMEVGVDGDRGMGWAMSQNTRSNGNDGTNGNDGMWRAVDRSGGPIWCS